MIFGEPQREALANPGLLPHVDVQSKALVVRPANPRAVVPHSDQHPAEDSATPSVVELGAAALAETKRLAEFQARLAALCATNRRQGTCPGVCVRRSFRQ